MKNQLQSIKDQFDSTSEFMNETDFNQVSKTIENLEAFQKLIQQGIQDKIHIMKSRGSRIQEIEILGIQENGSLNKKAKYSSTFSENPIPRVLILDLVENIRERVWDGQLDKLSFILHGIPLIRDENQKIKKKGNELSLELQKLLFQQVGYMYRQKMISREG